MSYVSVAYILQAPEGFRLDAMFSNITGVVCAIGLFVFFMLKRKDINKENTVETKEKTA